MTSTDPTDATGPVVSPYVLPDPVTDGHRPAGRSWYEQVRGITLDELGADPWDALVQDLTGPQFQRVSAWRTADTATRVELAELADLDDEHRIPGRHHDQAVDGDGDEAGWDS